MTETTHGRSRRAATMGFALQVLATLGTLGIWITTHSIAVLHLAAYLAAGIPCWFVALLVFRQHELAALEALDLEELKREKQATGGGEALFGEDGGAGAGFRVAQRRLEWMQNWLVPVFALITAAALLFGGVTRILFLRRIGIAVEKDPEAWPRILQPELGLVLLSVITLLLFVISRYASGLGRLPQWRLLRACATLAFGNTIAAASVVACLALILYRGGSGYAIESVVAWAIPILMIVLAAETIFNFVLDIYRPRSPGSEPRAAFDSRLLGLISEPGGIAHSLAEAMNYQFGFQVSQTWFYQLLQRAAVPLLWVGIAALWLLTCLVIVEPYERVIVERFGKLTNIDKPLEPGLHFKLPWPIDSVQRYNVDQLHTFAVGYKAGDHPKHHESDWKKGPPIELWTDAMHSGQEHFNFLIPPRSADAAPASRAAASQPDFADDAGVPLNLIRMEIFVQYKIRPAEVGRFALAAADASVRGQDPHRAIRQISWNEVGKLAAVTSADVLLGGGRETISETLRARIARRLQDLQFGLDVVWVGITNAHPEKSVAEAYRKLITSQQEKVKEIRNSRVEEDRVLSQVAGDPRRATRLADAIVRLLDAEIAHSRLAPPSGELPAAAAGELEALREPLSRRLAAEWSLRQSERAADRIQGEFDLGMGHTLRDIAAARASVAEAVGRRDAVAAEYKSLADAVSTRVPAAAVAEATARFTTGFWRQTLESYLTGLEGEAAVRLAQAQAKRWLEEASAEAQVKRLLNEREAYNASPRVYRARQYLWVLSDGLRNARKYFLAFDPGDRKVHIRFDLQESPADLSMIATAEKKEQ